LAAIQPATRVNLRQLRFATDREGERVDVHALYPRHRSLSAKVRVFVDAVAAHLAGPDVDPATIRSTYS